MDLGLGGRHYVVAGASSGLGAEVTQVLLEEGASVLGVARRDVSATWVSGGVDFGGQLTTLRADLSTSSGADALRVAISDGPALDGIIVTIGSGTPAGGSLAERFDASINRNVRPVLLTLDAALSFVIASENSSIVIVSSIAGVEWISCPPEYAAAKAALHALSGHLAREFAPRRFNVLAPGNMMTPGSVWERRSTEDSVALQGFLTQEVPLRRVADARENAMLAAYLLSPASSFVNGTTLVADGGQTRSW